MQKDVFGLLAEMNRKIELITDKADSNNGNKIQPLSTTSSALPEAMKSP